MATNILAFHGHLGPFQAFLCIFQKLFLIQYGESVTRSLSPLIQVLSIFGLWSFQEYISLATQISSIYRNDIERSIWRQQSEIWANLVIVWGCILLF